jgi:hypothetical protein
MHAVGVTTPPGVECALEPLLHCIDVDWRPRTGQAVGQLAPGDRTLGIFEDDGRGQTMTQLGAQRR